MQNKKSWYLPRVGLPPEKTSLLNLSIYETGSKILEASGDGEEEGKKEDMHLALSELLLIKDHLNEPTKHAGWLYLQDLDF